MENQHKKLLLLAEDVLISEEAKLNPIFLSIDVKLCDSVVNKNKEGTTAAFIEDVVNRSGDHLCLPFYADVKNLLAENYEQLGHLYNKVTKKFGTNMIGSMSEFRSETDEDGVTSLYGTIRVPKRDRDIVYRLVDLYEMGRFAVSVELSYDPREVVLMDGGKFIDASENSSLTGLCLVWKPACEDAYALDMVAEAADDSEEIVTGSEEPAERGETSFMEKEKKLTAEATEETVAEKEKTEQTETVAEEKAKDIAVAEGEGASESGEGASESGEGGSESGAGASDGAGASKSDGDDGSGSGDEGEDALTVDHDEDEKKIVAEEQKVTAEVLEHSVTTHESVENWGGDPVHVIEYHERIIETMEDAGELIAQLDQQIAELTEIKGKYDAMIAEEQARELAEKQEKAKAFAEKQGLNVEDTAVAEAIEKLDYKMIAEMSMANEQEEDREEPAKQMITLASFVEMEISDDKYGGLLSRKKN